MNFLQLVSCQVPFHRFMSPGEERRLLGQKQRTLLVTAQKSAWAAWLYLFLLPPNLTEASRAFLVSEGQQAGLHLSGTASVLHSSFSVLRKPRLAFKKDAVTIILIRKKSELCLSGRHSLSRFVAVQKSLMKYRKFSYSELLLSRKRGETVWLIGSDMHNSIITGQVTVGEDRQIIYSQS